GLGQPGLTMFEPAFVDELAAILRWSFDHLQQKEEGGSVYLRLSTRPIEQPKRALDEAGVPAGAYWLPHPAPGSEMAVIAAGAVLPEAIEAVACLGEAHAKIGLLAVTSADRLHGGWLASPGASVIDRLLAPLARDAVLATVIDGHPATLSWMGAVR